MTLCDDCLRKDEGFKTFVHPLVHELMGKNDRLAKSYGWQERWDIGSEVGTLVFSSAGVPQWRTRYSVVGTIERDSWEWAWANPHIPDAEKKDIEKVRALGEEKSYEQLTKPFLKADESTGWKMAAVAAHLLEAVGAYRLPTKSGFFYVIFRQIEKLNADGR